MKHERTIRIKCKYCGRRPWKSRTDAQYCNPACKQAFYRLHKAEKEEAEKQRLLAELAAAKQAKMEPLGSKPTQKPAPLPAQEFVKPKPIDPTPQQLARAIYFPVVKLELYPELDSAGNPIPSPKKPGYFIYVSRMGERKAIAPDVIAQARQNWEQKQSELA